MAFDPDEFLAKKDKEAEAPAETGGGFNVDAFLAKEEKEQAPQAQPQAQQGPVAPDESALMGAVAPAVMGYGMQPTGLGQLGQDVFAVTKPLAQSLAQGGRNVASVYKASPIMAPLADIIGMSTVGIPPVATTQSALGAYDKWKALEAGKNIGSQVLSQGAPTTSPVRGVPTTTTVGPYMDMIKSAPPEIAQKISETYGMKTGGAGNNAVRSWLNSAEGRAAMSANPEFAAKAAQYLGTVPGYGAQAMKVAGPILRGAARVAGPAGMAYNIYEAAPYLEQANIGQRTQSGEVGQMMRNAQRAMLNAPTPAPLKPEEAMNLLDSGDERTINIYGGRARLNDIVTSAIRAKAAKKALQPIQPIAPGQ